MIPSSAVFDQSTLTALLEHDPVVQEYRAFFALLDWTVVEQWPRRSRRGVHGHPKSAYLKARLLRLCEGHQYTTQLRRFLLKHPLLIIELGFQLVLDPQQPYGFDVEQTVPCDYWLRQQLRTLDHGLLQALLQATVAALQQAIPGLGEVVAFDVKHIYAWVKQNNPRVYVKERYKPDQRLAGDSDCKLGVKRSTNQEQSDGPTKEIKEDVWGYGSGVAAATDPVYGDVVLADYTLTFNEADVTYYRPLFQRTVVATNQFPTHVTAVRPSTSGMSMRPWPTARASLPSRSTTMVTRRCFVTPMAPHAALRACVCSLPTSFSTPMAFAPNAFAVLCCFPSRRARPVRMPNLPRVKAVSRTPIGKKVA